MRQRAFSALGHVVRAVTTVPEDSRPPSLLERGFSKLGVPLDVARTNAGAIALAREAAPDIVWIDNARTLRSTTLRRLRSMCPQAKLVWFSEDDVTLPHNLPRPLKGALPCFDLAFTTKSRALLPEGLPALGVRRVLFCNNSFDPQVHRPVSITDDERAALGSDVGFVGTFEPARAESMLALARAGISVRVWGGLWEQLREHHPKLRVEQRQLLGDDYAKAIAATKINLCMLRKANFDLQTSRTMEIPACGGFMLAERTVEHVRLFEENVEAVFFDAASPSELIDRTKYYLAHGDERRAIAQRGLQRCLVSRYDIPALLEWALEQALKVP
jgi:spore maturation protein CgeB